MASVQIPRFTAPRETGRKLFLLVRGPAVQPSGRYGIYDSTSAPQHFGQVYNRGALFLELTGVHLRMTEDPFRRVEVLTEISLELHRLSEESQQRMIERQFQTEQRQQQQQLQMEENQRQAEEYYRKMEEDHQQMRDLLSRMAQTVALMQADIVRLDETR